MYLEIADVTSHWRVSKEALRVFCYLWVININNISAFLKTFNSTLCIVIYWLYEKHLASGQLNGGDLLQVLASDKVQFITNVQGLD